MGIFVTEANLPMGITINNVYMSFNNEIIQILPKITNNVFRINAFYKIYKDDTKTLDTNIRIPLSITVNDMSIGIFTHLYNALKILYPNSQDVLENSQVVLDDSNTTLL